MNSVSLDGVMQAPGRPDEDRRGGFEHGGWAVPYSDETMRAELGRQLDQLTGGGHEWLFGRWTYEQLLSHWNAVGGPFRDPLNDIPKHVASSDPQTALEWPNSTLLDSDVPGAVADLRRSSAANLVIMGSGELIGSLIPAGLIDAYLISIVPVVLGSGRRMFPPGTRVSLELIDRVSTSTGVILATYASLA